MPHPHMIFDLEECEQLSSVPNKTTFIITTGQADINFLMWSVFSVLLRSKVNGFMEHINVSINGPDSRCGDPTIQNKKQAFLEELRNLKWQSEIDGPSRDMPLTIIRVWSRIGAEQAVEMAIPWVHTDSYTYIHDDTIWLTKNWEPLVMDELYKDKVALVYSTIILDRINWSKYNDKPKLNFPHTISPCMICRKPALAKCGVRWTGYHIENEFVLKEKIKDMKEFLNTHLPESDKRPTFRLGYANYDVWNQNFEYLSYDIGSWIYYTLKKEGYSINPVPGLNVHHFGSMSWAADSPTRSGATLFDKRIFDSQQYIQELENEIKQFPQYWNLYSKFKN